MDISQEHKEKIEKIIAESKCPKDFECYKSGFEKLCEARDTGMEGYIDCLEKTLQKCVFALPFGYGYFCCCPLRIYIAKELKK